MIKNLLYKYIDFISIFKMQNRNELQIVRREESEK